MLKISTVYLDKQKSSIPKKIYELSQEWTCFQNNQLCLLTQFLSEDFGFRDPMPPVPKPEEYQPSRICQILWVWFNEKWRSIVPQVIGHLTTHTQNNVKSLMWKNKSDQSFLLIEMCVLITLLALMLIL